MSVPGLGKRKRPPKRDWTAARAKVELEGCRVQGCPNPPEAAHVVGREYDSKRPVRGDFWRPLQVHPDRVIGLCNDHHQGPQGQHAKHLDILPLLTLDEQIQAVQDAGGISRAYALLMPSESSKLAANARADALAEALREIEKIASVPLGTLADIRRMAREALSTPEEGKG